jgi:hypothetical protein
VGAARASVYNNEAPDDFAKYLNIAVRKYGFNDFKTLRKYEKLADAAHQYLRFEKMSNYISRGRKYDAKTTETILKLFDKNVDFNKAIIGKWFFTDFVPAAASGESYSFTAEGKVIRTFTCCEPRFYKNYIGRYTIKGDKVIIKYDKLNEKQDASGYNRTIKVPKADKSETLVIDGVFCKIILIGRGAFGLCALIKH